ncbi:hypothetical protein JW911_01105 [Candidatus Peregrinibacteria bacterium]|nr:hypothetical protein [Candidatus Peregrinibacteria bacterium]
MPLFNLKKENPKEPVADITIQPPKPEPEKPVKPETPAAEGNVYTNIFEKPTAAKTEEVKSDIIQGVFTSEEKKLKPDENILGPLPELEKKIVGAFNPEKRKLNLIRTGFFALVVISLLLIGFFYIELTPEFDLLSGVRGQNTVQRLNNTQKDVIALQTSINQKNYLLLNYYLQEISYLSDTYLTARNKSLPENEIGTLRSNMLLAYENAYIKWKEPTTAGGIPDETFKTELKNSLTGELAKLKKENLTPDIETQINAYEATIRLVSNTRLGSFFKFNTDEIRAALPMDDSKIVEMANSALGLLQNDFSTISQIKSFRMNWADIINEIEKTTKSVDTLYNTGFFDELGGIRYSAFDLDSQSGKIVLTGNAKRDDGSTFSLIANLMDALEKSLMFSNVENRNFPKSGSDEEGYSSTFRIELSLENPTLPITPA